MRSCFIRFFHYNPISFVTNYYVTGITDAEGNFHINVMPNTKKVQLAFKVSQKAHSRKILEELMKYFDCGSIQVDNRRDDTLKFQVSKQSDLFTKVIPHFDKYLLQSSKNMDYLDFKKALLLVIDKKHITQEGFTTILNIKANMNKGRSWTDRYQYSLQHLLSPTKITVAEFEQWFVGFVDGDGSFYFHLFSKSGKVIIRPRLLIGQSNHAVCLLSFIKNNLKGGDIKPKIDILNEEDVANSAKVIKFSSTDKILPYILAIFEKNKIITQKKHDFDDFHKLCLLKKDKAYKTKEGKEEMINIARNINSKRKQKNN